MDINNSIKKMLGSKRPSRRNDWDNDGVINRKDCQPRNTMRQDKTSNKYNLTPISYDIYRALRSYKCKNGFKMSDFSYKDGKKIKFALLLGDCNKDWLNYLNSFGLRKEIHYVIIDSGSYAGYKAVVLYIE